MVGSDEQDWLNDFWNTENQAAKLAIIAAAIVTFGDALATIAAGLALEEIEQQSNAQDLDALKKQVHSLSKQMKALQRRSN